MDDIDGFQTSDSFRFDHQTSSSSLSSSSSGYGSGLHLFPVDHPSFASNRFGGLTKYLKEKLSRPKSLASLTSSSTAASRTAIEEQPSMEIYERVWNLDEQIDRIRSEIDRQISSDNQSIVSMSVDAPQSSIQNDQELLSAAAWYQEGLPRHICEEYLSTTNQPIGSFIIRHSYTHREYPYVLSVKTQSSLVEHFLIEGTNNHRDYRLQVSHSFAHL